METERAKELKTKKARDRRDRTVLSLNAITDYTFQGTFGFAAPVQI